MIEKSDIDRYRCAVNLRRSFRDNPIALHRMGLLSDQTFKAIRKVNGYFNSIENPVYRDAVRISMITGCNADTASQLAVKHSGKSDTDESLKRSLIRFVNNEYSRMK